MGKPPVYSVYPIATLRDLLHETVERYGDRVALQTKKEGVYRPLSYDQLGHQVKRLSTALCQLGLEQGERVALLSENRSEWAIAYLGIVTCGLVVIPIDKDLRTAEIQHIVDFAEARALICSTQYISEIQELRKKLPLLEHLISIEENASGTELSLPEMLVRGGEALQQGNTVFQDAVVKPEDLAVIIFTSGTMGNSKGVMLSHGNIASNVVATSHHIGINNEEVLLSVLPLHHAYECTAGFLTALYQGACICYAESLRRIGENLAETRSTVMLGVPLLFESMYRRIREGIQEQGPWKFRLAQAVASFGERVLRVNLRRRIFRKLHDRFGGRLELLICGGAAVNPEVGRGFRELGIHFIQGYGMTEASPIIAVNRIDWLKDDSVGLPLPGLEVREVDGEILVRGPTIMKGYYRNEKATGETVRDGWLHTGDLGYFDKEGFLYLNGRKKSVIVTPNGKNIYPEEVEAVLNQSPYIQESLVWGGAEEDFRLVEVQAIVVPNTETFDQTFGRPGYDEGKMDEVIGSEIKSCCRRLALYKRVKKFTLRNQEFEKTTTRKIKRYLYTGKPRVVPEEALQD